MFGLIGITVSLVLLHFITKPFIDDIEKAQAERDKYLRLLNFKDEDILKVYEERDHYAREHARMSDRFEEEWIKNDELKRKLENSDGLIEHYYKKKIEILEEELLKEREKNIYGEPNFSLVEIIIKRLKEENEQLKTSATIHTEEMKEIAALATEVKEDVNKLIQEKEQLHKKNQIMKKHVEFLMNSPGAIIPIQNERVDLMSNDEVLETIHIYEYEDDD